jgi:hypothetical protein
MSGSVMTKSDLEETMAFHIRAAGLPAPVREHQFIPGRKFKLDFAWIDLKVGIECQGGIWGNSKSKTLGHNSGAGITRDAVKNNLGILAGWQVLLVTKEHINSGEALKWIQQLIRQKEKQNQDLGTTPLRS